MKKIIFLFALLLIVGVAGSVLYLNRYTGLPIGGIDGLPKYRGDELTNIGDDPFIKQVPADYLERYKNELVSLEQSLSEDPQDDEKWLRVGLLKKFFNNYEGAKDAWEYAKIVNPKHSSIRYNLGVIYGSYLKDYQKAEENYLAAIDIDPYLPFLYYGLAEFYTVFYPEKKDLADDILERGIAANPEDELLRQALEQLKAGEGTAR